MIIYCFILIPICFSLVIVREAKLSHQKWIAYLCVLPLTIFAGVRGYVGIDTYAYHAIFVDTFSESLIETFSKFEPLFVLLMRVVGLFTDNPCIFIGVISVLQGVILIKLLKDSDRPAEFLLIYVTVFYLNFEFNMLRAGTAILIMLLAYKNFRSGDSRKLFLYGLMAGLMHYSVLLVVWPMLIMRAKGAGAWLRIVTVGMFVVSICGIYFFVMNNEFFREKMLLYIALVSAGDQFSSLVGVALRLVLYFLLYLSVVDKGNWRSMTMLFVVWMTLRLATIQFMFIDRVEVIVNALILFSIISLNLGGWRVRLRGVALVCIAILSLYSNLKGLSTSEDFNFRVQTGLNNSQIMSPYLPYHFFWEE